VDLASQVGGELDDLLGLGGAVSLLDGDVGGAAAPQEVGDLLLRLAAGFAGLGDPLAHDAGVERVRLRHGSLLGSVVVEW
jgi:hypothetical protein